MDESTYISIKNHQIHQGSKQHACCNPKKKRKNGASNGQWSCIFDNISKMTLNSTLDDSTLETIVSTPSDNLDSITISPFSVSLSREIKAIVDQNCIPEREISRIISVIITDLKSILAKKIPPHDIEPFGSFTNGLGSQESDLDIVCKFPSSNASVVQTLMGKISKLLSISRKFKKIVVIRQAKIPLIKMIHISTNRECDLSFKNVMGLHNTALMKSVMQIYPNSRILSLYLKYLLRKYKLFGTHKITTYILFWLVIFFLQAKFGFYGIQKLREQQTIKFNENGWNVSPILPKNKCYKPNYDHLYYLFRNFLKFYADFNFVEFIMCPYIGDKIHIREFNSLQLPSEYSIYMEKISNLEILNFSYHAINLQDPSEHNHNLSKQTEVKMLNGFKVFCHYLYRLLPAADNQPSKYTLSQILPKSLPINNYLPKNLIQYTSFYLNYSYLPVNPYSSLDPFSNVIKAIRKLMEIVFEFEKKHPVVQEVIEKNVTVSGKCTRGAFPVAYLSYLATNRTLQNENMLKVFSKNSETKLSDNDWNFEVIVICEEHGNMKGMNILLQSEVTFCDFMCKNLFNLLDLILKF